jgi:hypothetical protein
MDTVSHILDSLGGASAVGRELKLPQVTPRQWKRRGNIPTTYWPDLIALGERVGASVTADALMRACTVRTTEAAE